MPPPPHSSIFAQKSDSDVSSHSVNGYNVKQLLSFRPINPGAVPRDVKQLDNPQSSFGHSDSDSEEEDSDEEDSDEQQLLSDDEPILDSSTIYLLSS